MNEANSNLEYQKKDKGLRTGSINLLVTLAVILVPLGLYLLYMEKQESYFKAYYHRNLGNIAQIMDTRLSSLNYPWYNAKKHQQISDQPPLISSLPPWGTSLKIPKIEYSDTPFNTDDFLHTSIRARLGMQENKFFLEKKINTKESYSATLLVNNLISKQDNGSMFELLLLTDKNGNIYYEANDASPQLHRLTPETTKSFFSSEQVKPTTNTENVALPPTFSTNAAGNNYTIFCQVLSSSFYIEDDKENRLFLCGLVQSHHFQSKVKAISANKVIITINLLIIAFLLTPFLKLWFISPKEPYRRIDQIALRASFYFLIAIITIGLLDYLRYSRINERLDRSMETISIHMAKAFENELKEAVENIYAYDQCKITKSGVSLCDKFTTTIEPYGELTKPLIRYPPFELIGAVNSNGKTLPELEETARNEKTVVGDISKREYFQNVLNGPRWSDNVCGQLHKGCAIARITSMNEGVKMTAIAALSKADGNRELEFKAKPKICALARITSMNEGAKMTDLAALSKADGNRELEFKVKPKVNAMFKRFRTFISPPLPSSFKFAVVQNTDGLVLFHSDDRFSLVEKFFLEIEQSAELMETIRNLNPLSKRFIPYDGRYHGIDHRFVVKPLIIPDWTLVLLRDLSPVQTINAEIIFTSIACIFCFFGILVILMIVGKLLYERHVGGWNWPSLQYRDSYTAVLGLFGIIILTMGWLIYNNLFGKQLFILFILFSALAMSTVLALLMPRRCYQIKSLKSIVRFSLPVLIYAGVIWYLIKPAEPFSYPIFFTLLGFLWLLFYLIALYLFNWKNNTSATHTSWTVNLHILFSLFYFTILSILPAWAAFEDSWHNNIEAFTRSNLIEFSYSIEKRQQALRKDARRIRAHSEIENEGIDPCGYSLIYINSYVDECEQKGFSQKKYPKYDYLSRFIVNMLPTLNAFSARLRTFHSEHGVEQGKGKPAQNWSWSKDLDLYTLKKHNPNINNDINTPETMPKKVAPTELHASANELPLSIAIPGKKSAQLSKDNIILLIIVVLTWFIILWFIFRKIGNRIFAFDYLEVPTRLQIVPFDNPRAWDWWVKSKINRFIICPQDNVGENIKKLCKKNKSTRNVVVIDLSCEEEKSEDLYRQWFTKVNMLSDAIVILDNFESYIHEPSYSKAKLKLLSILLQDKNKVVHIVSQIDIPDCLQAFFQGRRMESQSSLEDVRQWIKILKKFQKANFDNFSKNWRDIDNEAEAILERECAWSNKLDVLKENLKKNPALYNWKESDIVSIISDQADLFYREQWLLCNEEEKRTLFHLARGHQFNPKNTIIMQCLLHRRLVTRDPEFKVVSESLRKFILHAESAERFTNWNKESKEGIWPILRTPLMGLLIVIAGILFFSQPETFKALAGFLAAFTAVSPILFRMFALSSSEK